MKPNHVPFYDNAEPEYDEDGRRFVDRIYCFDWDSFSDSEWTRLANTYELLPGWCGYGADPYVKGCPCWYGLDPDAGSHLSAAVEPPGIQLGGDVTDDELESWHERFLQLTNSLPRRDIDV